MNAYLGELAALATSLSFSFGSTAFTAAGRRIGSLTVNRIRLLIAALYLGVTHLILLGTLLPYGASKEHWLWFGLSGMVGLVLGDIFLFQSLVLIGPRIAMLMLSLAPVIASLLAWLFLGETLTLGQIFGIFLTLIGTGWVVLEGNGTNGDSHRYGRGILLGVGAAIGQASGLVLAKRGFVGGDLSPVSANLIRMLSAALLLWGITFFQGQVKSTFYTLRSKPKGFFFAIVGSFFGPFLGVTLSLFAVQHVEVGVASTLSSLPPVFLLPISYFAFKERFGWGAVFGTFLAMSGVGLLFLA